MAETGCSFEAALTATRAGNLFTTHTPVAAGFDRFTPDLVTERLRDYARNELHISLDQLIALGRANPGDANEPFNMAYLAVRGSGAVNGVSRLHGQVSRRIFQVLFPRWPETEVPVSHVTNGVHAPTWDSETSDAIWTAACGKQRWLGALDNAESGLRNVPAAELWRMRNCERKLLVDYVRERLARQMAGHGGGSQDIETARQVLDPDTLTLGFARRFAVYKRGDLLLRDPDRLLRILTNSRRPVQLILAGKAHPQDVEGQRIIRRWIEFIRGTGARARAVFLSDYDMRMAQHLTQGIDVWINTPRRPWEASGTSGMKVLVNGGLNLSELDGWWAEAYSEQFGWAIGDGREHDSDPAWDDAEARRIYDLLEQEIIPSFYHRDASGVPAGWIDRMRESMARLTPAFSANRTVREYTDEHYIPAMRAMAERSANGARLASEIVSWRREIERHWHNLRFGALNVESKIGEHAFTVQVFLDELNPDFIRVELFADAASGRPTFREAMVRGPALAGSADSYSFSKTVHTDRPASDFTPRIVPWHPDAITPLECNRILWREQ
jgi:starch phosphorylase